MLGMLQADPSLMQVAGDLIFRNMDFPGAEVIADRMAANNPMAQIDDKSPVPPQVQMQLKAAQAQVQQMQQQMQQMQLAMKQRQDIEQVKQDNETKRELMKQTAKAHDIEMRDAERRDVAKMEISGKAHDTVLKTQTQIQIEELKAHVAVLLAKMDETALHEASSETTERAI
jgi:hypothetical protein